MPPVFGPWSLSRTRLWSCDATSGTTRSPSLSTRNESSSPLRHSSNTTRVPASPSILPLSMSSAVRCASSLVCAMTTPLPAASPSALTTIGVWKSFRASCSSSLRVQTEYFAVGMRCRCMNSLAKLLLDSNCAAARVGPKIGQPRFWNSSTTPKVSGISGPTTVTSGVVDEFQKRGWPIFGPTRAAAQLESSKSFAKEFMQRHRIPTAKYSVCTRKDELHEALKLFHTPIVVKADGLAAGKGVVIAQTKDEAQRTAEDMLSGKMLGEAGTRVVLEECLKGDELSFLVLSDGERVVPLVASQDHKRVFDNDQGPNTGGMGAYSTDEIVDGQMREWLVTHIARPVIAGMRAVGAPYKGILYCGIMMTARGPVVLEFNCRFGDPETQPIMMRMESDLMEAIKASIAGRVSDGDFRWSPEPAVCVVMSSGG